MKRTFFAILFASLLLVGFAQKPYKVVFYNLENLFDTINDPNKNDEEYLPEGERKWTTYRYNQKLHNMERVLFDVALQDKNFPVVIGVSEIENRLVLEDLLAQPKLAKANYRIVHFDSPDRRGVDCAFFYRPNQFQLEGSEAHRISFPGRPNFLTRDLVAMWGKIEGEPFYFIVSHWPSRLGGKERSQYSRDFVAAKCKHICDSVRTVNPNTKVVIMGDFNDDATDASVVEVLGAKGNIKKLEANDMFNPFNAMLKAGYGTLAYRDSWNLFDNIVVSENLATGSTGALKIQKKEGAKFYGNIFTAPYMIQKEGQYKNYPLRSFVGSNFQNGYSDHFPVYIYIAK
ncbi:MAG: endonuclease/exonuclease/phosphatase family protein [Alistipes sp.]|nr:endonuclease/exonuclease/phosphatase family protein [Alistipes sp.]